ncbi:uncharacterized protein LOC115890678 [Sitophilus oryzae]|uniref:Uncharacterized protein LOC115890678 n=1 Tax=Sitophilus oryzae TaxID=7048 RepID=A0A6J2YVG2_SITOR|nr:uncharacterized protein LOC115890678 [Sitophilus oryzae]
MPKVGGPRAMKRRTMASAVTSMILYAAPIWRRAIQYQHYQNMLQSMIRRLAVLALAGVMAIVHQVEERCDTYRLGKEHRLQVRENILMKWQEDWQRYDGWTKQFIENVAEWHKNGWVEVDHFLTQAITGHGYFGIYLKRIATAVCTARSRILLRTLYSSVEDGGSLGPWQRQGAAPRSRWITSGHLWVKTKRRA